MDTDPFKERNIDKRTNIYFLLLSYWSTLTTSLTLLCTAVYLSFKSLQLTTDLNHSGFTFTTTPVTYYIGNMVSGPFQWDQTLESRLSSSGTSRCQVNRLDIVRGRFRSLRWSGHPYYLSLVGTGGPPVLWFPTSPTPTDI